MTSRLEAIRTYHDPKDEDVRYLLARIAELEAGILALKDAETAWVANRLDAAAGSEADKAAAALYSLLAPAQEEPR